MDDLPDPHFRELIHPHTGDVTRVRRPASGFSSDYAAIIHAEHGQFFVKGMFNDPGARLESLTKERDIAPFVQSVAPQLMWSVDGEGWVILGFEVVDGRMASFDPGTTDLPAVIEALNHIAKIPVPTVALDWIEERWDTFADNESEAELFRGATLLHTDINPSNIMIGTDRTWVVDWSWPTRGAGFIDPATLVVQLISGGHTPAYAESWAAQCHAWEAADPKALDAFAKAMWRLYRQRAIDFQAEWLGAMEEAAHTWVRYRIDGA
ncbi:protein kinase [Streptomyces flavofungini]|uniref:protein kinase n=1 Tax=Streptomyces flavofungini TaxID=68200 RepID=UPI0025B01E48|nr:protein kinase [Streptomyces flavofungini]WJV46527.1 protein kinase [Streptomyces flavofungini]